MTDDLTQETSPVTPAGHLKFTNAELDYLQSFLDRGDRGGYYMALYNFTGNTQCIEQAQISTFSEGSGGVAYAANYLLQRYLPAGNYPGIYYLSQKVAEFSLLAIQEKLRQNDTNQNANTGYININEMFQSANDAWAVGWLRDDSVNGRDLQRYFPANFLDSTIGLLNSDFSLPPLPDETSVLQSIVIIANDLFVHGTLNPEDFRNRLISEGTLAGIVGLAGGWLVGKQLSDYAGDPQHYDVRELPDSTYKIVTNLSTNKVIGVFNNELIPGSVAEVLNRLALNFPTIAATIVGGPAAGFTASVMSDFFRSFLVDFHKSLSESPTGFNGDIAPLRTNTFTGVELFPTTDQGTGANDTRWGTGGVLGFLHGDTLRGAAGNDRMFGGDGGDELHGDDGDDIVYGQSGNDSLFGEAGADTLRGGAGSDTLDGGDGNDTLDGDDVTPTSTGDDRLMGGRGNDLIVGGRGNDFLAGAAGTWQPGDHADPDNDTLIGGAGDDTYFFCCTFGQDTVIDSDGKGKLIIENHLLQGGTLKPDTANVYLSPDKYSTYTWVGNTLWISRKGITGTIKVNNWSNGELGVTLFGGAPKPKTGTASPLVLDYDGDGVVETLPLAAGVHFDHNGDGLAEATGWAGPEDALLVRDLDGDGQITSGKELFGAETLLPNGQKAANGFEALAALDVNGDGFVNSLDPGFEDLQVWRDANANGKVDQGELSDAVALFFSGSGPNQIATVYSSSGKVDAAGNAHRQLGGYTDNTGINHAMDDVWFATDLSDTQASQPGLPVPEDIAALPDLDGNGSLPLLHQAMVNDSVLKGYVQQFVASTDSAQQAVLMQSILWRWSGADTKDPNSRGSNLADARWLYMLEAFNGEAYVQTKGPQTGSANPGPAGAAAIYEDSQNLFELMYSRLTARSQLAGLYQLIDVTWNEIPNTFSYDYSAVAASLAATAASDHAQGLALIGSFVRSLAGSQMLSATAIAQLQSGLSGAGADAVALVSAPIAAWPPKTALEVALQGNDSVNGTAGNDSLYAGAGNDVLIGDAGNDELIGGTGNDTLDGGAGNDSLVGNDGADTYFFGIGSGQDTIYNSDRDATGTNVDRIVLGPGITTTNITVKRLGDDLLLGVAGANDTLRVQSYFKGDALTPDMVEYINFDNGTIWSYWTVRSKVLVGAAENDTLVAYSTGSTLSGGAGNDTLIGIDGADVLDGGSGDDILDGGAGNNTFQFGRGDGQDRIVASWDNTPSKLSGLVFKSGVLPADVTATRVANNLVLSIVGTADVVTIEDFFYPNAAALTRSPVQRIGFSNGAIWTASDFSALTPTPTAGPDHFLGTDGADTVSGGASNDWIDGGFGNDLLSGDADDDMLLGNAGNDELHGGTGNDSVLGGSGSDALFGEDGNDLLDGGKGIDTMTGGTGDDVYAVDDPSDVVVESSSAGTDTIRSSAAALITYTWTASNYLQRHLDFIDIPPLQANVENLTLVRAADASTNPYPLRIAIGNDGDNVIDASQEFVNPVLIDGGAGADTMIGSAQSNIYHVDNVGDVIIDPTSSPGARNQVLTFVDYTLSAGLDDLYMPDAYAGYVPLRGTGNNGDNVFESSHAGHDTMIGLGGNDTYYIAANDTVLEVENGGWDAVYGYQLNAAALANIEEFHGNQVTGDERDNLIFGGDSNGGAGNDTMYDCEPEGPELFGYGRDSAMYGGEGNDVLITMLGKDTLYGGLGDDLIVVRSNAGWSVDPTVGFERGDGHDRVQFESPDAATATRHLALNPGAGIDVTDLAFTLVDGALLVQVAGDDGGIAIEGPSGAEGSSASSYDLQLHFAGDGLVYERNVDGTVNQAWHDVVASRLATNNANVLTEGRDFLFGTSGADSMSANAGGDLLYGGTGNDTLTGSADSDQIWGGEGDDLLISSGTPDQGIDALNGGAGNDTYVINVGAGNVQIFDHGGVDVLQFGANVGPGDIRVRSYDSPNLYLESLDGTISVSVQYGVAVGTDTYFGDAGENYAVEQVRFADGTVWTLAQLREMATRIEGTDGADTLEGTYNDDRIFGYGGNDVIDAYDGNDLLDGGTGNDTLRGGAGNDVYVVDSASDVVSESANAGSDTVQASVSFTLGSNLENLTLTGASAINGTGNSLSNVLVGNGGANTLSGGTAADTMVGGAGDDTYLVDNAADVVTELASEGTDLVKAGVTYALAANVENLTLTGSGIINGTGNELANLLTGNSANNTLTGGAGNDTLDGGTGNDTMLGGTGNDTFVVNVSTDVVTEAANEGIDTVQSAVTLTLGGNVENLTLTGSGTTSGTGNTLDNVLVGNSANNTLTGLGGNDTLDGGTGNDTMLGGAGDDTFIVNVSTDVVTENAGEGTDTIQSAVTLTLGNNVENLTLTGSNAINGTGNTLANTLIGNTGANVLTGAAGDDIYDGGAGNDTFTDSVTTSNDTYRWGTGSGLDTLTDAGGSLDHIDLYAGIAKSQLKFVQNANDLELSVLGQADKLTIKNWYVGTANQIEEFRLSDGSKVLASEVNGLLSAMAAFVPMDSSTANQAKSGFIDMPISNPQLPQQAWM